MTAMRVLPVRLYGQKDSLRKRVRFAYVDDIDFPFLKQHTWLFSSNKSKTPKTTINSVGKHLSSFILPPKKGFFVRHKNKNSLDNRRENLFYSPITYISKCKNGGYQVHLTKREWFGTKQKFKWLKTKEEAKDFVKKNLSTK